MKKDDVPSSTEVARGRCASCRESGGSFRGRLFFPDGKRNTAGLCFFNGRKGSETLLQFLKNTHHSVAKLN